PAPAPAPAPLPPASDADQNLAEMAERLEAALRRPTGAGKSPPAAPGTSDPPSRPRGSELSSPALSRGEPPPVAPPGPKSGFEHLENEMASLLGRAKSPS
ncbi:MAG TPA: flagellar biosynthesis protein FliO, partial [Nitrobacter sp.]|nr:flagellar biosynthesis protein FliO [Nitrobacter sp.]